MNRPPALTETAPTPNLTEAATPRPEVTVIIPSYNRPELVQRAVSTALAQVDVTLEVLVIDDGSELPVATVLADADPRVRVLRNEPGRGVAFARNRGIDEARGEWVAFLDDDDLWAPHKLREQVAAMRSTGLQWSHTGTICLDDDLHVRWMGTPKRDDSHADQLRRGNLVGTPSCVAANTDFMRTLGGFDPSFSIMADWDMWIRMAEAGPGCAVRTPLIGYVTHIGSMHRQGMGPVLRELRQIKRKHRPSGPVGGVGIWRWIADTRRDSGHRLTAVPIYLAAALRWHHLETFIAGLRCLAPPLLRHRSKPAGVAPRWITRWYGP